MNSIRRYVNRLRDITFVPGCEKFYLCHRLGTVACLVYHRVVDPDNDAFEFMTRGGVPAISKLELYADLKFLKQHGATYLTFDDLREGKFPSTEEWAVIIAFDDCFFDNYTNGLEVLDSLKIPAVFFQTSGLIDRQELVWEHQIYWHTRTDELSVNFSTLANQILAQHHLEQRIDVRNVVLIVREECPFEVTASILEEASSDCCYPSTVGLYPTSAQVQSARDCGHEIGCHGRLHLMRKNISTCLFRSDLIRARDELTELLGKAPMSYSFPFSSFIAGDSDICHQLFDVVATVERDAIIRGWPETLTPRFTWPGPAKNSLRHRRWLLTGSI